MTIPTPPEPSPTSPPPAFPPPTLPPAGAAVPPPTTTPGGGTLPGQPAPTARNKRVAKVWAIGGVALVIALCCGGTVIAAIGDDADTAATAGTSAPATRPTTAAPPTATATPASAPTTAAPAYTPTKNDFKLKVKILSKQCFGSAGCNVTFRIEVAYTGASLDPYTTYEVTYEVKGAEDPIINTLEVTDDTASVQQEELASTRRSSDKLTAVVTSVSDL